MKFLWRVCSVCFDRDKERNGNYTSNECRDWLDADCVCYKYEQVVRQYRIMFSLFKVQIMVSKKQAKCLYSRTWILWIGLVYNLLNNSLHFAELRTSWSANCCDFYFQEWWFSTQLEHSNGPEKLSGEVPPIRNTNHIRHLKQLTAVYCDYIYPWLVLQTTSSQGISKIN